MKESNRVCLQKVNASLSLSLHTDIDVDIDMCLGCSTCIHVYAEVPDSDFGFITDLKDIQY